MNVHDLLSELGDDSQALQGAIIDTPDRVVIECEKEKRLPVELTQYELAQFGEKLAELTERQAELEAELKATRTQLKAGIDDVKAETMRVTSILRSRKEVRAVKCLRVLDFAHDLVRFIRTDTWREVSNMKMLPEDRQLEIKDEAEEPEGEAEGEGELEGEAEGEGELKEDGEDEPTK